MTFNTTFKVRCHAPHRQLELVGVIERVGPHEGAALQILRVVRRPHRHELAVLIPILNDPR